MRSPVVRLLLVPAAATALAATAVMTALPAHADVIDVSGTATVTEPFSYLATLANHEVHENAKSPATVTVDSTNQVVNAAFPVTGGNADASKLFGSLQLGGSVVFCGDDSHVTFTNVFYSIDNQDIEATPSGSTTPVSLLDLGGSIASSFNGTSQTVAATQLTVDPAGAAYLDSALHTTAFNAGDTAGSFTATWTVSGS